jgi:hypothetical protein
MRHDRALRGRLVWLCTPVLSVCAALTFAGAAAAKSVVCSGTVTAGHDRGYSHVTVKGVGCNAGKSALQAWIEKNLPSSSSQKTAQIPGWTCTYRVQQGASDRTTQISCRSATRKASGG